MIKQARNVPGLRNKERKLKKMMNKCIYIYLFICNILTSKQHYTNNIRITNKMKIYKFTRTRIIIIDSDFIIQFMKCTCENK